MNEKPGLEPGFFSDGRAAPVAEAGTAAPNQKYRKQPHAK